MPSARASELVLFDYHDDFEITITENNDEITDAGLAAYEAVFFLNPTGDVFGAEEEQAFESWMRAGGAFIGVHSAADTEIEWEFYKELTGQYYNGHGAPGTAGAIVFEEDALDFPALRGLPNPWHRDEEWYLFNAAAEWEFKPGFKILGRKASDNQPIVWSREWGNFRSFDTAIGHHGEVFRDPSVKEHLTGGILWAVRREHLVE